MKMREVKLNLFDVQTTGQASLSAEMKTFYENTLIDMAEPKLVHDRFADKYPIPKNNGKTIELRKYSSLAKATTPLVEGVTPAGNMLSVTAKTATVKMCIRDRTIRLIHPPRSDMCIMKKYQGTT